MDQIDEKIKFLAELEKAEDFENAAAVDGVYVGKKKLPKSSIACFKAYGWINAKRDELVKTVWDVHSSAESMKMWDSDIVTYGTTSIDLNTRVCYQINSLPWPVWSRDTCYLQHKIIQENKTYILAYSVESDTYPVIADKYVRAHISISAFVFEDNGEGCDVYRIAHVEPGGSIPPAIINSNAKKVAKAIIALKKLEKKVI